MGDLKEYCLLTAGRVCALFSSRDNFSAVPSHPNQEGPRRFLDARSGVTSAVFGEADGSDVHTQSRATFFEL